MNRSTLSVAASRHEAIAADRPAPARVRAAPSIVPCHGAGADRSRMLVLAQLPPPEHGASVVNRQVVNSQILAEAFDLTVIPIAMSADITRLRKFGLVKIARSLRLFGTVAGQLFGRTRPDLVYFTLSPAGWAFFRDLALIAMIRMAGLRCVFHLHGRGVAASIEKAPWRRHLYRFAFARSFVITLGGALRDDITGLAPDDRIFVVPNGVADSAGQPRNTGNDEGTRRPNDSPPRVLFLSNMLKEKGPLVLLEALAMVAERGVPFEAQFAGAWRPPISKDGFAARVQALGLEDQVTLLGAVYGEAKARLFADADLFVLPTYYDHEALPLVVIEAMMHGLAVITTKIGALPGVIADQASGELIEPANISQLASALEKLLTDPDLRARYGRAARQKYEADLTAQRFEQRLREVLLQIASRPSHASA
jgi:glycosyltransferase involved in cell wall biosynthesis